MNIIKEKINVEQTILQLANRKGYIKHSLEFIKKVLQSINKIGVNKTSKMFNISKSVIKSWRVPTWNAYNQKLQRMRYPDKQKLMKRVRYAKDKKHQIKINLKYQTKRYHSDPGFRLKCLLRSRVWRVLKDQSVHKTNRFNDYTGCTVQELKEYMESMFQKGMTWDNYGEWHVDHITPCSSFDLSDLNEQTKCFHYTNLQPLWSVDNLKKGSKIS